MRGWIRYRYGVIHEDLGHEVKSEVGGWVLYQHGVIHEDLGHVRSLGQKSGRVRYRHGVFHEDLGHDVKSNVGFCIDTVSSMRI